MQDNIENQIISKKNQEKLKTFRIRRNSSRKHQKNNEYTALHYPVLYYTKLLYTTLSQQQQILLYNTLPFHYGPNRIQTMMTKTKNFSIDSFIFFTASVPRHFQSINYNVLLLSVCQSPPGNPTSWWTGDFCSKRVELKLLKALLGTVLTQELIMCQMTSTGLFLNLNQE